MKSLFIITLITTALWGGYRIVSKIQANRHYLGYLKRAADANSIDLAKQELGKAITEIEKQGLTSGFTSVLYNTPSEDVGFWYKNLKTSLKDLEDLPAASPSFEKSNMLLKLRETLLDGGEHGEDITYPKAVYLHPYNVFVAWFGIVSCITLLISFFITGNRAGWFEK